MAVFLLWWEIFAGCAVVVLAITTEKKSSSRLSGRLSVFGSGDYDRKKKVPVVIKFVLVKLESKLIHIG